jgi:acetyl-CoA carboxylase, biotin carboxylase subunit
MDEKQNFYMLEVNTRVQVEHPVTEMITGVDIVKRCIRSPAGEPLPIKQRDVRIRGHAMECRINAEDPDKGFRQARGRSKRWMCPAGRACGWIRTWCPATRVPPNYDSMIGKLIVHADDRQQCDRPHGAGAARVQVGPIKTTIRCTCG